LEERNLHVEAISGLSVGDFEVEIVERKGKGHPDSLTDGAAEEVSRGLCQYYRKEFGQILHHNVDKGILVGGRSEPVFGGGSVLSPIYLMIAGRATEKVVRNGKQLEIPVEQIAVNSIKRFIRENMRFLDPEKHVQIETKIKQGSADLIDVFLRRDRVPASNDTSIGVGYAPLTPTEELVLGIEKELLNSQKFKKKYPEVGEDIKVMGLRRNKKLSITVAAAMISSLIPDASHYESVLSDVTREVEDYTSRSELEVDVKVNSADDPKHGTYYLTVTGTSAEQGDDGNTGRGNRVNGLICPMRQYSMEATAGKNPVNHTGKIFNALALLSARQIAKEVKGVREVYVRILSRIGNPIDQPQIASAALVLEKGVTLSSVRGDVLSILDNSFKGIDKITDKILGGEIDLF
jgi:S-adenosylmethionine synthetase